MKEIILVRHAKSSWENNSIDHQRPLKKRGYNDAELVAERFLTYSIKPQIVYSSDAVRAFTTAQIFKEKLNISDANFKLEPTLYDFGGNRLIKFIKEIENIHESVMIFGHNEAITSFVNTYGDVHTENVPTSGLTLIRIDIPSWTDLKSGKTILSLYPNELKV